MKPLNEIPGAQAIPETEDLEIAINTHNGGTATPVMTFSLMGHGYSDTPVEIGTMGPFGRIDVSGKADWLDRIGAKWFCTHDRIPANADDHSAAYALITAEGGNLTFFNVAPDLDGILWPLSSSRYRWIHAGYELVGGITPHTALMAAVGKELDAAQEIVAVLSARLVELGGTIPARATTLPKMNGIASLGNNATYASGDHIHPTDTTRAPLSSPSFTGSARVNGYRIVVNNDTSSYSYNTMIGNYTVIGGYASSSVALTGYGIHLFNTDQCVCIGMYTEVGDSNYAHSSYNSLAIGNYNSVAGYQNHAFGCDLSITAQQENTILIGTNDSAVIKCGTQISAFNPLGSRKARLAIGFSDYHDAEPFFGIQQVDPISGIAAGVKIRLSAFMNLLRSYGGEDWTLSDAGSGYSTDEYGNEYDYTDNYSY